MSSVNTEIDEEYVRGCSVCGSRTITERNIDTTGPSDSGSYVKVIEKIVRPASEDMREGKR